MALNSCILLVAMCLFMELSQGMRTNEQLQPQQGYTDATDATVEPPMLSMLETATDLQCCARRSQHWRRVIEYRLKEKGKVCHSKSWFHTNFPYQVKRSCCGNLKEGGLLKVSESPCVDGHDPSDFNAVKAGPNFQCPTGTTCVMTNYYEGAEMLPISGDRFVECPNGKFDQKSQSRFGLMCLKLNQIRCEEFGAHEDPKQRGFCICDQNTVCTVCSGGVCRRGGGVCRRDGVSFRLIMTQIKGLTPKCTNDQIKG